MNQFENDNFLATYVYLGPYKSMFWDASEPRYDDLGLLEQYCGLAYIGEVAYIVK